MAYARSVVSARQRAYSRSRKRLTHSTSRPVVVSTIQKGLRAPPGVRWITWNVMQAEPLRGTAETAAHRRPEQKSCWDRSHRAEGHAVQTRPERRVVATAIARQTGRFRLRR